MSNVSSSLNLVVTTGITPFHSILMSGMLNLYKDTLGSKGQNSSILTLTNTILPYFYKMNFNRGK